MESNRKFAQLVEKLGRAFDASRSHRQQYVRALLAIADFFHDMKPLDVYSNRLMILASALDDLDDGIELPIFVANVPSNRVSGSKEVWLGRALVAASLDARLRLGETRDGAASSIAADFPSLSALTTPKAKSLKTAALSWYSEFNGQRVKNRHAVKVFSAVRDHLQKCEALDQKAEMINVARQTISGANRIALGLSPHC
jgi:hypothetical protein